MNELLGKRVKNKYIIIEELDNSLYVIQDETTFKCGIYSRVLDKISDVGYNSILEKVGDFILADTNEGIEVLRKDGTQFIEDKFDNYEKLYNSKNFILLTKGNNKGILKKDGTWLLEPKCKTLQIDDKGVRAESDDGNRVMLSNKVFI